MPVGPGEQRTNVVNVLRFVLSRRDSVPVLAQKLTGRLKGQRSSYSADDNDRWIAQHSADPAGVATALEPDLWQEALEFGCELRERAEPLLESVPFDMGAGGDYEFLYWLTRLRSPDVVVETGVSAGWTSQAFLSAMARNGHGHLYSSDFPYFRTKEPERYIGILVEPQLRERWTLYTDGDRRALPRILGASPEVGIFHYDSDKSFDGRAYGVEAVLPHLAADGVIVMDDISNDSWFREYVERRGLDYHVFRRRYGVIGQITGANCT